MSEKKIEKKKENTGTDIDNYMAHSFPVIPMSRTISGTSSEKIILTC